MTSIIVQVVGGATCFVYIAIQKTSKNFMIEKLKTRIRKEKEKM